MFKAKVIIVKFVFANEMNMVFMGGGRPSEKYIYSVHQFFDTEWFSNIIISACFKSLELIVCHRPGCKKKDGNVRTEHPDFAGECESILFRKHYVKKAKRKATIQECFMSFFAIPAPRYIESF